jgi:uncharacterized membrane protein
MDWLPRTDTVMLVVTAYVAVITLIRLMRRRRDEVITDVQRQVEAHRRNQKNQPKKARDAA